MSVVLAVFTVTGAACWLFTASFLAWVAWDGREVRRCERARATRRQR
jgi:hypothetical protein